MNNRSTFQLGIAATVKGQAGLKDLQADLRQTGIEGGRAASMLSSGWAKAAS